MRKNWLIMKRNIIQTILELIFPVLLFLLIIGLRQIFNRDSHPFEELDGTVDHLMVNKTILSSVGFNKVVVKSYLDPTVNLKFTDLFDVNKYTRDNISNLDLSEIDLTELIDNDKIDEFKNDLYNNYTLAQYYLTYLEMPIYINPYYICSQNNSKKELRPKIALIGEVPDEIIYKMIKDSIIYNTFTPIKYELNKDSFLKFKTIKEMETVIKGKNYKNKKDELVCFGLKFLYNETENAFDYSLHFFDFEIIGRGETSDVPTCKYGMFDKYQNGPDLQSYGIYTNGGYNYVMKIVNEYILKNQTNEKYSSLSYAVTPMKYIDFRVDPFGQFFGNITAICILIAYIFPLNIYVYRIVKEKESRIREGMKIMGLGDGEYFLSYFIQYVVISLPVSALNAYIFQQVLTTIPYYYLYCMIFLFSLDVFALVYFCQSFIDKTKISIVLTFIIYAIMYCMILTCIFEQSGGFRFKLFMSLIPAVNLNLSIALLFKFDYHFKKFYDRDFTIKHYNYSLSWAFIMYVVDFFIFIFLGYYFSNVLPHDYGIRKPWYFLFSPEYWCKKRKKKYYSRKDKSKLEEFRTDESKTLDEESRSYKKDKNAFKRINLYLNNSKFESEDIYEDKDENDVFEIRNIVKIFDDGKKAVNGVNLNFYRDEIFALLGHNGAGKTTLISMLTGMYEATKGKAIFDGNNILDSNNMNIFREKVGICPQHDTLFEELTIREHLEMFSIFKGVSKDKVNEEVSKVLHDFQIEDIQNMLAGNLSAGQRRKLSIAISLIGGSEVIFLDEPSSGMDITSRRNLWEILKHQVVGKIIILTTHYMEEASVLGKRIGIINAGKMKCLGSPLFLIEKYGRFMSLNVSKEEDADNETIVDFVKSLSENAEYEVLSEEIIFRIPIKDDKNEEKKLKKILDIPNFFKMFDENINNLKIKSYSISMPTLEDVFLNVAAEDDKRIQKEKEKEYQLVIPQESNEQLLFGSDLKHKYTGCEKFNRDFSISMKRRFLMTIRDIKGLMMEIVGPILLVIFGLLLSKLQIVDKSKPYEINDLEITGNQMVLFSSLNGTKYQDYFNEIENGKYFVKFNDTNDYKDCVIKYQYVKKYIENVYDIYHVTENSADKLVDMSSDDYVGYYGSILMISDSQKSNYEFILNLNARVTHSVSIYSYYFLKSIIEKESKKYNPNRELKIKFTHYPMPFTDDIKEQDDIINNEAIMFFFSIAFAIMPANFISVLVKERANNSKHLMRVSGMNILSYWFVNYIFEFIKYYFTGGMCILCLYIFGDYKEYIYIMYLLYGPAMISSTYFISFFFNDDSKAQNFIILFNLVFGSLGCIVILLLRLLENMRKLGEILEYFVALVPVFCFDFSYNLAINKSTIYSLLFDPEEYLNFTGDEMIKKFSLMLMLVYYCSAEVVVYTILFIIAESRTYSFKKPENKKLISKVNDSEVIKEIEKTNSLEVSLLKEEDFEVTRNTVDTFKPTSSKQIAIKVKNLRKIYGGGCLNKEKNIAIDNLNFCIESGECFGLLGLNGAGKTTTFKCITQEISPDNGEISIYGKDIRGNFNELNDLFGYCPQFDAIFEHLTVYENLEFYATIKGIKKNLIDALVKNMILEMALTEFTNKIAGRLSGGNKRKLSVAISMLGNPPIILLDEPSTGMDPEARRFMWSVIHKMSTKGRKSSIILTTHSMDEAETLCKRMGIMVNGEFVCMGSAAQIKDTYGYGYECNIRIKPMPQEKQLEILENKSISYDTKVNNDNLSQILNSLNKSSFLDELKPGRLGGRLIKNINLHGYTHILTLLNWIFFVENALKFITHGSEYFSQIILSEYIENNFIFKLLKGKEQKSIGFLFGLFEEKKDECHVTEYSLQQTSLEQIFNKFAASQGKNNNEDTNIKLEENDGIVIDEDLLNNLLD